MIKNHLDKNNLHHAYLIEGAKEAIVPEILEFFENIGIKTSGNPDFYQVLIDSFKIDDSFILREMGVEKKFGSNKKIFLICANSFTLDAQGVLLKLFEEPTKDTHFFLVVPDINILFKTLISRFYLIKAGGSNNENQKKAEKFISSPYQARINFIKELLSEEDENSTNSARSKSLDFLNALENVLNNKTKKEKNTDISFFNQIFKAREYIRQPGSSTKNLMESVALSIPIF